MLTGPATRPIQCFLSSKMQEILINDQLIKSVMTLCLLAVVRKRRL